MAKWERLLDLYDEIDEDPSFADLRDRGARLVRGDGAESVQHARVMVIGPAPRTRDQGEGKPFAGTDGRILDGLLGLAGFHRSQCFITTVVKYRSPGNKAPSLYHQLKAKEWLGREWLIIQPKLTICVGAVAHDTAHPVGHVMSLGSMPRGELHRYRVKLRDGSDPWVTTQFHPLLGLQDPKMRPHMERDWQTLWEMCKDVGGILCPLCDGISAREGVDCDGCQA